MKHYGPFPFRLTATAVGIAVLCVGVLSSRFAYADPTENAVPGEFVVKMKPEQPGPLHLLSPVQALLKSVHVKLAKRFKRSERLYKVKLAEINGSHEKAVAALMASGDVERIEPNYIYDLFDTPPVDMTDPHLADLWALGNHGQASSKGLPGLPGVDLGVEALWAKGQFGSDKVVVAVIDSGIDATHPDLVGSLYVNPGEIPGNGLDDDKNGYTDDAQGWDTIKDTPLIFDEVGHGTHVAGTIAAQHGNGLGVSGIAPGVKILPIRATRRNATLADLLEALDYARIMKVQIINASWGGPIYSQLMEEAVKKVTDEGILIVAAAGNSAKDNDKVAVYPAGFDLPGIISVGAVDNQGVMPYFSNFGAISVDVAAPGVGILSTQPVNMSGDPSDPYGYRDGTSMAAPQVTGVAALLKSIRPNLSADDLKNLLIRTAVKYRTLQGRVASAGVVNAAAAADALVSPEPLRLEDAAFANQAYPLETPHPYPNSQNIHEPLVTEYRVTVPGAKAIRVHLASYDLEVLANVLPVDWIRISDAKGFGVQELTGHGVDLKSEYVEGDTLVITLTADANGAHDGFVVDSVDVAY